jgi:hypothetical protein
MRRAASSLLLALAVSLVGCQSGESVARSAPAAATPRLLEVARTSERPLLDAIGRIHAGETTPVSADADAFAVGAAPGARVRVETVYPADLMVAVDGRALLTPRSLDQQQRLVAGGAGYYLAVITNIPPFEPGKPAVWDVYVVLPSTATRPRVEIATVSVNPAHVGGARMSLPLVVPVR